MWKTITAVIIGSALFGWAMVAAMNHDVEARTQWVCIEGLAYVKQHGVLIHVEGIADNVRHPRRWVECYEAQP